MNVIDSKTSASRLLSEAEETRAAEYLTSTRDDLLRAVGGLSDEQMRWKPFPDQWSIA